MYRSWLNMLYKPEFSAAVLSYSFVRGCLPCVQEAYMSIDFCLSLVNLLLLGPQTRIQKGREEISFPSLHKWHTFYHLHYSPGPGIPHWVPSLFFPLSLNTLVLTTIILSQNLFPFPVQDTCLVSPWLIRTRVLPCLLHFSPSELGICSTLSPSTETITDDIWFCTYLNIFWDTFLLGSTHLSS